MTPGITYYYRTYVIGDDGIKRYGETRSFMTKDKFDNIISESSVTFLGTKAEVAFYIDKTKIPQNKYDYQVYKCYVAMSADKSKLSADSISLSAKKAIRLEDCKVNSSNKVTFDFWQIRIGATCYYRCYTDVNGKKIFGDIQSFKIEFKVATSGYVDLGLSSGTKWSACNYGASTPQDIGTEIEKNSISENNLSAPSYEQMDELVRHCTWYYTTNYMGQSGYYVTGNNGNSIFIPLGHYWSTSEDDRGTLALYLYEKKFIYRIGILPIWSLQVR